MAKPRKQKTLPGMERKVIKEVSDAAEAYVEARDTRMAHTVKEADQKEALLAVMEKNKLEVYTDPDAVPPFTVTIKKGKANVKVEKRDASADEDDDKEDAA